jgi:hypothetical protein
MVPSFLHIAAHNCQEATIASPSRGNTQWRGVGLALLHAARGYSGGLIIQLLVMMAWGPALSYGDVVGWMPGVAGAVKEGGT